MASGLPVVATDDAMRRTLTGQAGIVCNVENSVEYAQAIQTALEREWGDLPIEQASHYSWKNVAERYAEVINSM